MTLLGTRDTAQAAAHLARFLKTTLVFVLANSNAVIALLIYRSGLVDQLVPTSVGGLFGSHESLIAAETALAIGTRFKKIFDLHRRALSAAEHAKSQERINSLRMFAANLEKAFSGFEPDFFHHNLTCIVDDAIAVIKSTLELRSTLVEICYFQKLRHSLPMKKIA